MSSTFLSRVRLEGARVHVYITSCFAGCASGQAIGLPNSFLHHRPIPASNSQALAAQKQLLEYYTAVHSSMLIFPRMLLKFV